MEKINQIICYLIAIQNFAKDIHYKCKGDSFYGQHLLADRIQNDLVGFQDSLKETCILGNDLEPLPSAEYLDGAKPLIPLIVDDMQANFKAMQNLLIAALSAIESTLGTTRGEQSLIDSIAQDLQQKLGLVNREVK